MRIWKSYLSLGVAGLVGSGAIAGPMDGPMITQDISAAGPWDQGGLEFSMMVGPYFGPDVPTGPAKDTFNYFSNNFRLGYNITGLLGENSWYRGNLQVVGELFLAEIMAGGGSYIVGPNLLFRYNFVPAGWNFAPYVQLGPGLAFTDSDNSAFGQNFNFQLNIAVGGRYMISDKWSVNTELGWHHLSNADTAEHNLGSNAMAGTVGFSYFFR